MESCLGNCGFIYTLASAQLALCADTCWARSSQRVVHISVVVFGCQELARCQLRFAVKEQDSSFWLVAIGGAPSLLILVTFMSSHWIPFHRWDLHCDLLALRTGTMMFGSWRLWLRKGKGYSHSENEYIPLTLNVKRHRCRNGEWPRFLVFQTDRKPSHIPLGTWIPKRRLKSDPW